MRDKTCMRRYVHVLVILAVILSGISPACAFVSGKSSSIIEICTADGMKTVKVPGEQSPEQKPAKTIDCGFCFAQTHLKSASAPVALIAYIPQFFPDVVFSETSVQVEKFELAALSARAPPTSL
jgi:hypothetical protein